MNVLVIGGLGFIGHHVSRRLVDLGYRVTIFDNETTYGILDPKKHQTLIEERKRYIGPNVFCIHGDITDYHRLRFSYQYARPDIVINLASYPRAKIVDTDPSAARKTIIDGHENVLRFCRENSAVKRLVYISSSMVYGDFKNGVTETAETKPSNMYATMKLLSEQITRHYAKKGNFDYTIIRPSAVYGPRDVEDRVVARFFENAISNKPLKVNGKDEQLDFTYVDDLAEGIIIAATRKGGANETFNMTYGKEEYISRAASLVLDIVGSGQIQVLEKDPKMPSRGHLDISKAKDMLQYNPKIDITNGFPKYYEWLQDSVFRSDETIFYS